MAEVALEESLTWSMRILSVLEILECETLNKSSHMTNGSLKTVYQMIRIMVFSLCAGIEVNPVAEINYPHGENGAFLLEEQRLSRSQPSTDVETPHPCHEGSHGDTVIYVQSNASLFP